jgi:hypothetical protein
MPRKSSEVARLSLEIRDHEPCEKRDDEAPRGGGRKARMIVQFGDKTIAPPSTPCAGIQPAAWKLALMGFS